jgi:hypothetical protein
MQESLIMQTWQKLLANAQAVIDNKFFLGVLAFVAVLAFILGRWSK